VVLNPFARIVDLKIATVGHDPIGFGEP